MKIFWVLLGFFGAGTAALFSQAGVSPRPPAEFPTYSYQVLDVPDPSTSTPPVTTAKPPTLSKTGSGGGGGTSGTIPGGMVLRNMRVDQDFADICNDQGRKGYRLAHIVPKGQRLRLVFERAYPGSPK